MEFGSFRAIDALSLAIDFGEVRAVIGPNGAGKTTMLDVVSGITRAKQGRVVFDDAIDITRTSESEIARAGVRRKFQKPSIFEGLDVRQHIAIGAQGGLRRTLSPDALARRIDDVLVEIGLADLALRSASELAHGQKQWLEIGMVLASQPKVLMLDEPVAGLTDEETERTVALVRKLRRPDRAIVVVEHDMDFVEQIADRVTVLHEGRTLFEGSMQDARADARVVDVYLGR
ncbi:ABC transporter ATP-binding protein [Bradyrhizobium liaoningense]|nr:ABC transporter ATP-binding protein [Bradyrhizobium liaoningense]